MGGLGAGMLFAIQRRCLWTVHRTMSTVHADRILAISDIHVDHQHNQKLLDSLSPCRYADDVLLLAGDVTDDVRLLETTLLSLSEKFRAVFFVPGNHDLWVRSHEEGIDSLTKFRQVLAICDRVGVHHTPRKIVLPSDSVWVVPLFSWYSKPEEDSSNSLGISSPGASDPARDDRMWMDTRFCRWDSLPSGTTPSEYFAQKNSEAMSAKYDAPIISFSHFLPRQDLILPSEEEILNTIKERQELGFLEGSLPERQGGVKGFNFTRYAGCARIEGQIRELQSVLHVHGHQHRNRDRVVDGVRYVSHCLGYQREQTQGWLWGLQKAQYGPRQIWP